VVNAFKDAMQVELAGKDDLLGFLNAQACSGRVVITDKGPMSAFLQKTVGDAVMNDRNMNVWGVEFKIEQAFTGNLFLETWSNLSRRTPGWMVNLNTDIVLYYFLDTGVMYSMGFRKLADWAFGKSDNYRNGERVANCSPGRIYEFPERKQRRRNQPNDTWGRLVPVVVLEREIGAAMYRRQTNGTFHRSMVGR